MRTRLKEVSGIDWFDGAVMNCQWSGPLLCDVLRSVGVASQPAPPLPLHDNSGSSSGSGSGSGSDPVTDPGTLHVAFASHQTACQDDTYYGSSIPLARCLRPSAEIILALDANGSPLTPERGFPLRVVAPGIAGARAVKWLDRITVQAAESPNFYQQRDYKILPPEAVDARAAEEWWGRVPAIQDMPVNSVVAVPDSGETVMRRKKTATKTTTESGSTKEGNGDEAVDEGEEEGMDGEGKVYAKGYALPAGEDGPVTRVEVSGDNGHTWTDARLIVPPSSFSSDNNNNNNNNNDDGDEHNQNLAQAHVSKWAWMLWEAYVKVEPGHGRKILSRATDKAGNTQPASPQWNFRGVAYNGYGEADELTVL